MTQFSRTRFLAMALFLAVAVAAFAADVTGQWTADVPSRGGNPQSVTFTFKVDGTTLTGSIANPRGETPISDGKIDGDNISFSQVVNFNGNEFKLNYKGVVAGDEIKFTRTRDGGQGRIQEFTAKRK